MGSVLCELRRGGMRRGKRILRPLLPWEAKSGRSEVNRRNRIAPETGSELWDKNRIGRNLESRSFDRLFSFTVRKGGKQYERIEPDQPCGG